MTESRNFRFKIAVIGDNEVGKTPLMRKFAKGGFEVDIVKL